MSHAAPQRPRLTAAARPSAVSGIANATYLFCLPGSSGACRDARDKVIVEQLDYRTRPRDLVDLMPRLLERRCDAKPGPASIASRHSTCPIEGS